MNIRYVYASNFLSFEVSLFFSRSLYFFFSSSYVKHTFGSLTQEGFVFVFAPLTRLPFCVSFKFILYILYANTRIMYSVICVRGNVLILQTERIEFMNKRYCEILSDPNFPRPKRRKASSTQ